MAVAATGIYSTAYRLKLMLAACASIQSLLEADTEAAALAKISTYAGEDLLWPRCLVEEEPVTLERVDVSYSAAERQLQFFLEFYVPDAVAADTTSDEHCWALTQLGTVATEILELAGTGEPVAGSTHLNIHTLTLTRVDKASHDERPDISTERTNDPLWLAVFDVGLM